MGRLQRGSLNLLCGVAAMMLALPLGKAAAYAARPQVKLARERTRAGEPFKLKVFVSSGVPLGAYTLQLSFDPAVLELTSIGGGAADFAAQPITNPGKFASGVVRFSAFQPMRMDGPRGLCYVATLTFEPRASKGGTRVEVEALTIADTLGSTYPPSKGHRTLRFRGR
jgi:hypothetical protein